MKPQARRDDQHIEARKNHVKVIPFNPLHSVLFLASADPPVIERRVAAAPYSNDRNPEGWERTAMSRLLVVEDEAVLRRNIVDRLRAEGHDVVEASNGETGVKLASVLAPDLVLTDLRLPGLDGLSVLREIKKTAPRTLVVLMTAHGSQQTAVEALREGAYDYLTKPVELKE